MPSGVISEIQKFLSENGIERSEAAAEANLIVTELSGLSTEEILMGKEIPAGDIEKIRAAAEKRVSTGAPIQHILGFGYFMGDKFEVNPDVLIPRPETELLVRLSTKVACEILTNSGFLKGGTLNILDIGTGTGCIPCEISKNLLAEGFKDGVEIMGVDISTAALQVAIRNMEALGQQRRVIFRKSDIFKGLREIDKFDIIVSNPPYIPLTEQPHLQDEVKNFDPALALFTSDRWGVEFYEKIIKGAKSHLKANTPGGAKVLFELGANYSAGAGFSQAEIVSKIAYENGFKVDFIEKDLSGHSRVIQLSA